MRALVWIFVLVCLSASAEESQKETRREWLNRNSECLVAVALSAALGAKWVVTQYSDRQLARLASETLPFETDRGRIANQYEPRTFFHTLPNPTHRYLVRPPGILLVPRRAATVPAERLAQVTARTTARQRGYVNALDGEDASSPPGIDSEFHRNLSALVAHLQTTDHDRRWFVQYENTAKVQALLRGLAIFGAPFRPHREANSIDLLLHAVAQNPHQSNTALSPIERRLVEDLPALQEYGTSLLPQIVAEVNRRHPDVKWDPILRDLRFGPKAQDEIRFGLHEGVLTENILRRYAQAAARGYDLMVFVEPERVPRLQSLLLETFALSGMDGAPIGIWDALLRDSPRPAHAPERQADAIVYLLSSQSAELAETFPYLVDLTKPDGR